MPCSHTMPHRATPRDTTPHYARPRSTRPDHTTQKNTRKRTNFSAPSLLFIRQSLVAKGGAASSPGLATSAACHGRACLFRSPARRPPPLLPADRPLRARWPPKPLGRSTAALSVCIYIYIYIYIYILSTHIHIYQYVYIYIYIYIYISSPRLEREAPSPIPAAFLRRPSHTRCIAPLPRWLSSRAGWVRDKASAPRRGVGLVGSLLRQIRCGRQG